jgi:transposase
LPLSTFLAAKIKELTGLERSLSQVREFLKAIEMRFMKVGSVPAKADPEVQEKFLNEEIEPRLVARKYVLT